MRTVFLLSAGAALLAALAGCAGAPAAGVPARSIFTDLHCSADAPGVRRIADAAQWEALRRQFARRRIGPPAAEPAAPDFARESVFVVDMGRRSSLGHSVALAGREAKLRDGRLELRVAWEEPAAGMQQGQMLTSPCVAVAVRAGDYAEVVAVDARGEVRARSGAPARQSSG